jgi:hypothetical protein
MCGHVDTRSSLSFSKRKKGVPSIIMPSFDYRSIDGHQESDTDTENAWREPRKEASARSPGTRGV